MNKEQKYTLYAAQLEKLANSQRQIKIDNPNLTPLQKKVALVVHCCDFDVCEIDYNGIKGYILWDCQQAQYRGEDRCESIDEFLEKYSVTRLEDVTLLLSDAFFDDYGFDKSKVFDESVTDFNECYDKEAV